jgi:hypothetical protein
MNKFVKFIAETDEFGNVLWLWRQKPCERMARPVKELLSLDLELKTSVTEGASLDAILAWLTKERLKVAPSLISAL